MTKNTVAAIDILDKSYLDKISEWRINDLKPMKII